MTRHADLQQLLKHVPAVQFVSSGDLSEGRWWVKLGLDLDHPLCWRVVQEFAHVLNYVSVKERLPTVFMPVSPPLPEEEMAEIQWVKPKLVAQVRFVEWTADGLLRHSAFFGLRGSQRGSQSGGTDHQQNPFEWLLTWNLR